MNDDRPIERPLDAPIRCTLPWLFLTLLGSLACANGGATIGVVAAPPAGSSVSFTHDVQAIFEARGCTTAGCHATPVFAPMSLEAGQSYANLVNVASCEAPASKRVDPAHSALSYLIVKLDGSFTVVESSGGCAAGCAFGGVTYTAQNNCGALMPLGAITPIDNSEIQIIRDWIDQGAPNN